MRFPFGDGFSKSSEVMIFPMVFPTFLHQWTYLHGLERSSSYDFHPQKAGHVCSRPMALIPAKAPKKLQAINLGSKSHKSSELQRIFQRFMTVTACIYQRQLVSFTGCFLWVPIACLGEKKNCPPSSFTCFQPRGRKLRRWIFIGALHLGPVGFAPAGIWFLLSKGLDPTDVWWLAKVEGKSPTSRIVRLQWWTKIYFFWIYTNGERQREIHVCVCRIYECRQIQVYGIQYTSSFHQCWSQH